MKRLLFSLSVLGTASVLLFACQEGVKKDPKPVDLKDLTANQTEVHGDLVKESDIILKTPLDAPMVTAGKATYELKCQSCHRLSGEKLVGPGWKEITTRRKPVWIMNMILNVDIMLEKDTAAQALLEQCMVRMPNQNITKEQGREVLEFMRSNDGVK
ncbi:MAG: c-type cytochrome [Candidatus Pseudobacter hemicellulosilyticus]|uniref:C-type cytochrome n=1 Tax=Candidatus Pseudobacter hemicellulosilyticus TaxID=3121375 RepID=A0AAJ5WNL2_9BACT|nr:MAG: c-type cytochrome [Pseudobacter sp.]